MICPSGSRFVLFLGRPHFSHIVPVGERVRGQRCGRRQTWSTCPAAWAASPKAGQRSCQNQAQAREKKETGVSRIAQKQRGGKTTGEESRARKSLKKRNQRSGREYQTERGEEIAAVSSKKRRKRRQQTLPRGTCGSCATFHSHCLPRPRLLARAA